MVEIIPYTEDDEDTSTWIPLIQPNQDNRGSNSSRTQTERPEAKDRTNDSSVWQDISSPSQTSTSQSLMISESKPSSWEMQLISHLTSTPNAPARDEGYSSENDENIEWKHANELNDGDKSREQHKSNPPENTGRQPQRSRSSYTNHNKQRQRPHATENTSGPRTHEHEDQNSELVSYRQEAKDKLQKTLIYHPMRELPFRMLRNLYIEGKQELHQAWNAYIQDNGGAVIFAPLTFFLVIAFLGVALIGIGVFRIGSIALFAAIRVTISLLELTVWGARGMITHLAWLSLLFFLAMGALIWISMDKVRKSSIVNILARSEPDSQDAPDVSTLLPWVVALTSPSMYELVACLYSLQALSLPVSNVAVNNMDYTHECDANIGTSTILPPFISFITSLLVVTSTCLGIYTFAEYLDKDADDYTNNIEDTKDEKLHAPRQLNRYLKRIQRNLNACHTLSVVVLTLSAVMFLLMRAAYLYFGGDFINILSGLGIIGYHLLCVTIGTALVLWAGKAALNELPASNEESEDGNIYQRIARNALKESIIDVATNAVWSNVSGLSGVLSEEDGILRLAVLEWLIDRMTSSETSNQPSSSTSTSRSEHQESSSSTTNLSDINSAGIRDETELRQSSSSESKTNNNSPKDRSQSSSSGHVDILKNLPSYESIENVISKLDADEALIPAIQSYQTWIYSLPPTRNVAMAVACWKICPGMVALLLFVAWSLFMRMKEALVTFIHSQYGSEYCAFSNITQNNWLGLFAFIMSPIIYLEYLRVRRWWTRVACSIEETKCSDEADTIPDSLAIMMEYDYDKLSSPSYLNKLIMKIWNLLLESIVMLESSIPVVRCATVACAAANFTSDAACLVDLAVEIKNRGLLAGISMLVIDAFSHHLHEELQRRHTESNDEASPVERIVASDELSGKYTNSLIKSVGHASKIVHNLSRLQGDGKKSMKPSNESDSYNGVDDNPSLNEESGPLSLDASAKDSTDVDRGVDCSAADADVSKTFKDDLAPKDSSTPSNSASVDDFQDTFTDQVVEKRDKNKETDLDSVVSRTTDEQTIGIVTSRTENDDTSGDKNERGDGGVPMWLGGGLAVVGAVVGGLAVAAANGKKNEEKNRQRESDSK